MAAPDRDPGLMAVLQAVGGVGKLAAGLGVKRQSISDWTRVPHARLFEVARLANLDPAQIRPDLAGWIIERRQADRMALARSHYGIAARAMNPRLGFVPARRINDEVAADIVTAIAACRFVAQARGLKFAEVMVGAERAAAAARALAMALAHVVGRAQSSNIGAMFGTSRQNVDNASERYLRARDGDDPDDFVGQGPDGKGRVVERGRVRRAKDAAEELWDLERQFAAMIAGDDDGAREKRA